MKLGKYLLWAGLTAFLPVIVPMHVSGQQFSREFDSQVEKAMGEWAVPGLAVGVVKDDRLVFARGYGLRKVDGRGRVDEKTLFAIASNTKGFTAAALGILVDEGKITWDAPIREFLPGFELYDPYVTHEVTVRDLLAHRVGLERGDLLSWDSVMTREEVVRRARYLKPVAPFRSSLVYSNLMYTVAGEIVPALTKTSWDDFVRERLFKPLGMSATNTSISALRGIENVAEPHRRIDGRVQAIPWLNSDTDGPAGAINSNVVDMSQWLRFQLSEGSFKGQKIISPNALKEIQTPQNLMRLEPPWSQIWPEAHFLAYGFGWYLHDHRGRKVIVHGGQTDGMSSLIAFMPEERLGLVILTNMGDTFLHVALMYKIFDAYVPGEKRDWNADLLKVFKNFGDQNEKPAPDAEKQARSCLPLEKYVGTYHDDLYGDATVSLEDGKLHLRFLKAQGDLQPRYDDTFAIRWKSYNFLLKSDVQSVSFVVDPSRSVDEMRIEGAGIFKRSR